MSATKKNNIESYFHDQRVSEVFSVVSAMTSGLRDQSTAVLRYDRQVVNLSHPKKYRTLDPNAFHYFPHSKYGGAHRSLHVSNMDRAGFNIKAVANKSCLHFVRKIRDSILGHNLTDK